MTTEWFKQVSKVVRDEVAKPFLPGDPDPLVEVLKKVVSKLYAGCQNGGEYGADECPSCRALRTEQAEKEVKSLTATLKGEVVNRTEWWNKFTQADSKVSGLQAEVDVLSQVVKAAGDDNNALVRLLGDSVADRTNLAQENGELRKHLAERDLSIAILTSADEAHVKEAQRVKALVSQLAGE